MPQVQPAEKVANVEQWWTADRAAAYLGRSTKTLLEMARQGKLQTARSEIGAHPRLYNPEDCKALKAAPDYTAAVTVDAGTPLKLPANPKTALARFVPPGALQSLSAIALAGASQPLLAPSELKHKVYLSEDEAVAYTGLSKAYLAEQAIEKAIECHPRRGPKQSLVYRRADLDNL